MGNHAEPKGSLRKLLRRGRAASGQAMVEYVLIAILVCLAIAAVVTLTGPAVGNVFSNTVYNLMDQKGSPYPTRSADEVKEMMTAVASYVPPPRVLHTNTPLPVSQLITPAPLQVQIEATRAPFTGQK